MVEEGHRRHYTRFLLLDVQKEAAESAEMKEASVDSSFEAAVDLVPLDWLDLALVEGP